MRIEEIFETDLDSRECEAVSGERITLTVSKDEKVWFMDILNRRERKDAYERMRALLRYLRMRHETKAQPRAS